MFLHANGIHSESQYFDIFKEIYKAHILINRIVQRCRHLYLLHLLIIAIAFSACKSRPFQGTKWDLGNNHAEFQKVLEFYSQPKDSLKFRAAKFLIDRMKGEYYYKAKNEEEQDSFLRSIPAQIHIPFPDTSSQYEMLRRKLVDDIVSSAIEEGKVCEPRYQKYYDSKSLTAEFLIENIEYAFKAWEFPWAKSYSFDDFSRYILPYRCGTEAPGPWRKKYYNAFKWIADSIEGSDGPLEAATLLNEQFRYELSFSEALKKCGFKLDIGNHVDAMAYESCYGQARIGVCMLRALGIAATTDHVPKWGHISFGHELSAMMDADGKWHYFNFGETGPKKDLKFVAPKMYLKEFGKSDQNKTVYTDATGLLIKVYDLAIEINASPDDDVYLCTFGNLKWEALCKGINKESSVLFENVGVGKRMYLAAVPQGKSLRPVSYPFSTDTTGNITYYKSESAKTIESTFIRKFPEWGIYNPRRASIIGGEFFVASKPDFSDEKLIYKIVDTLKYNWNILKVAEQKGKYFRYKFPNSMDSIFDGPAEVAFYSSNGEGFHKIEGSYFASPQLSQNHIDLLTDDDILTYLQVWNYEKETDLKVSNFVFKKPKDDLWIGLKPDNESTVTHVGICPRNDKNGIYPGMMYELFYWDNEWVSLGKQKATGDSIRYAKIPANAVLWLRNLDEGREERIFTLKQGKVNWW